MYSYMQSIPHSKMASLISGKRMIYFTVINDVAWKCGRNHHSVICLGSPSSMQKSMLDSMYHWPPQLSSSIFPQKTHIIQRHHTSFI